MGIKWDDDETRAEVIAILAAFQAANQTAQQAGQNVNQSLSDLLQSQAQTTGSSTVESNVGDIGGDEDREKNLIMSGEHVEMNKKLTFDQHLYALMRNGDQSRVHFDTATIDGHIEGMSLKNVALQSVSNLVENANMVAKQAIRDAALATDRQWNVDEQGYQATDILSNKTFTDGIKAFVVATMAEALSSNKE